MNQKKNIVIISTMYYPDMGAPSAVLDKYVKKLEDKYNFYIITKTYVPGVVDTQNIRYISNWSHKLSLKCDKRNYLPNKICRSAIRGYKLIETQFAYPYANSWEIGKINNILEDLTNKIKIDAVIAVSNTFFCQFATFKYKHKHPEVKWIAFVTDPFSENYVYYKYKLFKSYWKRRNIKNEKLIYDTADYLLFSEEMYKFAVDKFNVSKDKAFNMGFALDDIRKGKMPNILSTGESIKMIYAGMFYQQIRNPEFMLETLNNVDHIKVDLFVDRCECEDLLTSYVSEKIKRYTFANRDRYEQMICDEYDILLSVGNISTLQSPSKTLELLSTGRPIIHFYFAKDSQFEMIEKYPLGLNIANGESDAASKISEFCKKVKGKCLSFEKVLELYPEHSLEKKTALFESLIER